MDGTAGRANMGYERRTLLRAGALLPVLLVPGCATTGGALDLTAVIRQLLTYASQRAFATLMAPNGFYDSTIARIALPDSLGGRGTASLLSAVLNTAAFRDRLTRQVNRACEKGAEQAAPVVTQAIRSLSVADALAILRGGGSAATDLLRGQMGDALVRAMLPGVAEGLRLFDSEVVTQALRLVTGIDFAALHDDVTRKASNAIYAAIGAEERAIRADPRSTGDPLLIAALTALR